MKSITLPRLKKHDFKSLMEEVTLLMKPVCSMLQVTNGDGRIGVTYAPLTQFRRIGVFGRCNVDLASERIDNLARQAFWTKGKVWNTITKEAVHGETGITVELRRV